MATVTMGGSLQRWAARWRAGQAGAYIRWSWHHVVALVWRRLGLSGLLLLALTCACALGVLASLWQRAELDVARSKAASGAEQALLRVLPVAPSPAMRDREALQAFLHGLPEAATIPESVRSLLDEAEKQGLATVKGDYQLQVDAAAGFARYRMALPVQGSSAQVRRFIALSLVAQPSLGIDSLQLRREQIASDRIDARINWVLYTRLPDPNVTQRGRP